MTRVGGPRDTLMASRDIDGKEGWALGGVWPLTWSCARGTMDGGIVPNGGAE